MIVTSKPRATRPLTTWMPVGPVPPMTSARVMIVDGLPGIVLRASPTPRQRELAAHEDARNACAALAVEAQIADPRDLPGGVAPGCEVGAYRRNDRRTDATVLVVGLGRHRPDPGSTVDGMAPEPDRLAVCVARRERSAELNRAIQLGHPMWVRASGEVVSAGSGLALDGDPLRRIAPERGVDRHVDAEPLAPEPARLEQHADAGVREVDARPDIAGDRTREQQVLRAELARPIGDRVDQLLALSLALFAGRHRAED